MSITSPLALTTTFSPPAACTTETWIVEYLTGSYYFTTSVMEPGADWFFSQGPIDWSSCFPSGYQVTTDFYYSPGICPSGYSIASATIVSLGTNTETRAACCPSSYTAQSNNNYVWFTENRCFSDNQDPDHVWTYNHGQSTANITTPDNDHNSSKRYKYRISHETHSFDLTALGHGNKRSLCGRYELPQPEPSRAWIAGPTIGAVIACAVIALVATWYNRRRWREKDIVPMEYTSQPSQELAYQPSNRISELGQEPQVYEVYLEMTARKNIAVLTNLPSRAKFAPVRQLEAPHMPLVDFRECRVLKIAHAASIAPHIPRSMNTLKHHQR
ncbi:hypothetical protein N7452_000629 [Penicillium brevicompactum]|uniref:Uncharacterized protein n=1 Tax=Penicillium brevicompactum TaxID=5074 RepID=A0A9W9UQD4_PENBR|nr:hypothetical protein N7452_000629 [Penicillium brevicompactum]